MYNSGSGGGKSAENRVWSEKEGRRDSRQKVRKKLKRQVTKVGKGKEIEKETTTQPPKFHKVIL